MTLLAACHLWHAMPAGSHCSYSSDMTAMIGTIALFIFWPSYNGALASNPGFSVSGAAGMLGSL